MAQIQLYIAKTQVTHKGLININPSEDVARHIIDFAAALDILDYDPSKQNIFYLISFIEEGLLLTLLRPFGGAPLNHYAATLFFAHGLEISKEQFNNILSAVRKAIEPAADPDTESIAELRRILAPDYGCDQNKANIPPSSGSKYALAYFGAPAPEWSDYEAHSFYQPEYQKYAGIILVNTLSEAKAKPSSVNITAPLLDMSLVEPPRSTPEGFIPYIGRSAFKSPVLTAKSSTFEIFWRRSGFETISQKIEVSDKPVTKIQPINTQAARKIITLASFYVSEQGSRKPITSYKVKVNGRIIDGPIPFSYRDLTSAQVEIKADGYEPFAARLDLAATAQPLVQLRRMNNAYFFELPIVADVPCEPVKFCVTSKKSLVKCPFEGYNTASGKLAEGPDNPNTLIYVGGNSRRNTVITAAIAVGALLLGILIGCLFSGNKEVGNKTIEHDVETVVEAVAAAPADTVEEIAEEVMAEDTVSVQLQPIETPVADPKAAVAYLDANKNWRRSEMDAIPGLEGFFDDLNQYNFDRIKDYWASRLADSRNFKSVLHAIEGSATKRSPRKVPHSPNYNSDGDEIINWLKYTYWVDP